MTKDLALPQTLRRLAAHGVDEICIGLLLFPLWRLIWDVFTTDEDVFISIPMLFFILFFPMLYQFVFLMLFSRTPGKWLLNMWVVDAHDSSQKISWAQALLRALTSRLSLFLSWAIYALAFFRYDRTHLADWVAETRVMQESETPRRPRLHPWFAGFLVVFYAGEGFSQAMMIWESIDWGSNRVELHDFFASTWNSDLGFEAAEEEAD